MEEVTIKILDKTGHTEKTVAIQEALVEVTQELENGKWLFVDGVYTNRETLSTQLLVEAKEVLLTNQIQGG